jgi:hypothetical protein
LRLFRNREARTRQIWRWKGQRKGSGNSPHAVRGEQHTNSTHFCTHFPHSRRPAFCPHQRTPRRAHPIRAGARTGFRCAEQREGDSAVDHRGRMHAESPAIEVDSSLGEFRVRRVLDRIALERRLLEAFWTTDRSLAGIICSLQVGFACALTAPDVLSLLRPEESRLRLPDFKRRNTPVLSGYGQPIP